MVSIEIQPSGNGGCPSADRQSGHGAAAPLH
jgi:hypothetical protein